MSGILPYFSFSVVRIKSYKYETVLLAFSHLKIRFAFHLTYFFHVTSKILPI